MFRDAVPDTGPRWRIALARTVLFAAGFLFSLGNGGCSQPSTPTSTVTQVAEDRGPAPMAKQNLLLIIADTLRADRVGMRRKDKLLMPHVSRLAAESWDFRVCRVPATWTKPSMASLFTSFYPGVHRVLYGIDGDIDTENLPKTDVLPELFETFAEYMKANGYRTVGIQTNANITGHFGFGQGFDSYEYLQYPKHHGDDITKLALERLEGLDTPFFLYVHYMDAHAPYETPTGFADADADFPELKDEDRALLANYGDCYRDRIMFEVGITSKRKYSNLSRDGEEYVRAKYDSSVHFLDGEIGRLVAQVLERAPETIVALTSDHGEELWEHGSIGHAKTVYEELTRVPLIVRVPGGKPRTVDAPAELIDVLPTCASVLGLPQRETWQGKILGSSAPVDRPVFSVATMSISGSNRDLEAVVIGTHKLIQDNIAGTRTYYDLDKDPAELAGNVETDGFGAENLEKLLEGHRASNMAHPSYQSSATVNELTPAQEENMRAIGYLR